MNEERQKLFDRMKLVLQPLSKRVHNLDLSAISELTSASEEGLNPVFETIAKRIIAARNKGASVIFMMGAHVIRSGVQKYIIDLLKKKFLSCISMNGAGMIHDYEFALVGGTTESVAGYIKEGQFGLWQETGRLNDIINNAYYQDGSIGMGEAVGRAIEELDLPYKEVSILATAWRYSVPVTVHVGIGYDIIHEFANCNGAATGKLSYNDFLKFAAVVQMLENGIVMNFGSAVMGPEIFLKALSMARNVAKQQKQAIRNFSTLVCDIHPFDNTNFHQEPAQTDPAYFFRPWKTLLVRTVADGGESFYVSGRHDETIPSLWRALRSVEG